MPTFFRLSLTRFTLFLSVKYLSNCAPVFEYGRRGVTERNKIGIILFGNLHNIYYLCDTGREYLVSNIIKKNKKKGAFAPLFFICT